MSGDPGGGDVIADRYEMKHHLWLRNQSYTFFEKRLLDTLIELSIFNDLTSILPSIK